MHRLATVHARDNQRSGPPGIPLREFPEFGIGGNSREFCENCDRLFFPVISLFVQFHYHLQQTLSVNYNVLRLTNEKIVLQWQTAHADAVAGLPVPLAGLRRTAEPVWSTRLQTFLPKDLYIRSLFLPVLNFHPLSGYHWR